MHVLLVAVARYFSGGVAICYVLVAFMLLARHSLSI